MSNEKHYDEKNDALSAQCTQHLEKADRWFSALKLIVGIGQACLQLFLFSWLYILKEKFSFSKFRADDDDDDDDVCKGICLPSMQILTRQYANFDS